MLICVPETPEGLEPGSEAIPPTYGSELRKLPFAGFAREIVAAAGLDPQIVLPTTSEAFVRPAPRPAYSVLGHDALAGTGVAPIGDWAQRWAEASRAVLGD